MRLRALQQLAAARRQTALPTDLGQIAFYAAGVAADSTGGSSGDDVYINSISVPEPSALALQMVGVLAVAVIAEARRRRIGPARGG
jgi:hypothetical protein